MWTHKTISAMEDHVRGRVTMHSMRRRETTPEPAIEKLPPRLMVVATSVSCFLFGVVVGIAVF